MAKKPKAAATASVETKTLRDKLQAVSGVKRAPAPEGAGPVIVTGKGRAGRRSVAIYMQPLAKEQLDRIALEHDKSIQALGIEALNLLFRHYDMPPIA